MRGPDQTSTGTERASETAIHFVCEAQLSPAQQSGDSKAGNKICSRVGSRGQRTQYDNGQGSGAHLRPPAGRGGRRGEPEKEA